MKMKRENLVLMFDDESGYKNIAKFNLAYHTDKYSLYDFYTALAMEFNDNIKALDYVDYENGDKDLTLEFILKGVSLITIGSEFIFSATADKEQIIKLANSFKELISAALIKADSLNFEELTI